MSRAGRGIHASTVALLVAVVGLASYMYSTRDKPGAAELKTREGNLFASWRREDINKITLDIAGERGVLERRSGGANAWVWQSPWAVPADPAKVDALTAQLERARPLRTAPADGIGPAQATVTVQMGTLSHTVVLHGPAKSPEGAAYARVGDQTFVISSDLAVALRTPLSGYRERALVPSAHLSPSNLRLRGAAFELTLERRGDTYFRGTRRVSRDQITQTLAALGQLRADDFLPNATKEQDSAPRLHLRAEAPGLAPVELELGGACADAGTVARVLGESPLVACVPSGPVRALLAAPEAYDDPKVFASAADETGEISIEAQGVKVDLARRGTGFHLRVPEDRDLVADEADHVARLLAYVLGTKGTEPRVPGPPPQVPLAKVMIRAGDHTEHAQVFAGGLVQRQDDGAWLTVDPEALVPFTWPRLWTRSQRVFSAQVARAELGDLRGECGRGLWHVQRGAQGFVSVTPKGAAVDGARAVALLDAVLQLRAERWVAPHDDGTQGTQNARCRVTFVSGADGGRAEHSLLIGAESGDSFFARVAGDEPVMRVSKAFVTQLRAGVL